ncbi:MAG: hypothetical protein HUK22_02590, partial [Thermoguttaceae bacterium]|nr:hypothetical protein [Thermoguttaceae bacterium]
MKIEKFCVAMCVLALAVSFAGCKKSGIPGLVPAEGVVTLNGAPVEGATVIFTPKKVDMSSEASSATAMTN